MGNRVCLGAAGKRLGVGGGDIRRAGYAKVAAARPGAWEHQSPAWLRQARERKSRPPRTAAGRSGHPTGVLCCACGRVRQVRPSLVGGYPHLVCGRCGKAGRSPDVPSRPGTVPVHECGIAGFSADRICGIAAAEERAGTASAAPLVRVVFPDWSGGPGPDG